MSAATSSSNDRAAQDRVIAQQRAHEPSMEEILASIRRIIADDQRPAGRAEPQPAATLAPDRPANLDDVTAPPPARAAAPVVEPPRPVAPRVAAPAVEPEARRAEPVRPAAPVVAAPVAPPAPVAPAVAPPSPELHVEPIAAEEDEAAEIVAALDEEEDDIVELTTPAAPAAAAPAAESQAIEPLRLVSAETDAAVIAQFQQLQATLMADNARRVDELTRELLRPMLKSWLDDNLPVLVEKLVRIEIERVARGGR